MKPISKLPLHELTAMARDVVAQHHYEVVGAVPAEGDSAYAELVVALNADLDSTWRTADDWRSPKASGKYS